MTVREALDHPQDPDRAVPCARHRIPGKHLRDPLGALAHGEKPQDHAPVGFQWKDDAGTAGGDVTMPPSGWENVSR